MIILPLQLKTMAQGLNPELREAIFQRGVRRTNSTQVKVLVYLFVTKLLIVIKAKFMWKIRHLKALRLLLNCLRAKR